MLDTLTEKVFYVCREIVNVSVFWLAGRRENLTVRDRMVQTPLVEDVAIDPTKDAVVIDGVTKVFKKSRPLFHWFHKQKDEDERKREVRAVDNVSLTIKRREIVGILGANGSGKSTLIRMLSTLLIPDTGSISIFGYDVVKDERMVQRLIN